MQAHGCFTLHHRSPGSRALWAERLDDHCPLCLSVSLPSHFRCSLPHLQDPGMCWDYSERAFCPLHWHQFPGRPGWIYLHSGESRCAVNGRGRMRGGSQLLAGRMRVALQRLWRCGAGVLSLLCFRYTVRWGDPRLLVTDEGVMGPYCLRGTLVAHWILPLNCPFIIPKGSWNDQDLGWSLRLLRIKSH